MSFVAGTFRFSVDPLNKLFRVANYKELDGDAKTGGG